MKAYQCKLCGQLVVPELSEECLVDHLMLVHKDMIEAYLDQDDLDCSIDCRDHYQMVTDVNAYNIWQPVKIYRVYQVYARSDGEAMERYRRGEAKYLHSPYLDDPSGSFTALPGASPEVDEHLTRMYDEDQVLEGAMV